MAFTGTTAEIVVGDFCLELGTAITDINLERVQALSGELVVAQAIDAAGNPARRLEVLPHDHYSRLSKEEMRTYRVPEKRLLEVPPVVGYLDAFGNNPHVFAIQQLTGSTRLIRYPNPTFPYLLRHAGIVESAG